MATTPADTFHRQKMQSLLESGRFSDVTLVVVVVVGDGGSGDGNGDVLLDLKEEKEFKVHHALLATFSPVFEAMFSHPDTKEAQERRVLIEDVSAETMQRLLTFIYTGELKFEEKKGKVIRSLLELMAAADKVLFVCLCTGFPKLQQLIFSPFSLLPSVSGGAAEEEV